MDYKKIKASKLDMFDREFSAKYFGYGDEIDYLNNESFDRRVKNIKTPLLCMYTKDDPVVLISSFDKKDLLENVNIIYTELNSGGHLGFYTGLRPRKWLHKPIFEFLNSLNDNL